MAVNIAQKVVKLVLKEIVKLIILDRFKSKGQLKQLKANYNYQQVEI